jgi:hypothetical protein
MHHGVMLHLKDASNYVIFSPLSSRSSSVVISLQLGLAVNVMKYEGLVKIRTIAMES